MPLQTTSVAGVYRGGTCQPNLSNFTLPVTGPIIYCWFPNIPPHTLNPISGTFYLGMLVGSGTINSITLPVYLCDQIRLVTNFGTTCSPTFNTIG